MFVCVTDDSSRAGQAWLEMVAFFSRQSQLYNYRHAVDDNVALYQYHSLLREREAMARHMPQYQQHSNPHVPPNASQHHSPHSSNQTSQAQHYPGSSHVKTHSSMSNIDLPQDGARSRSGESWLPPHDSPIKREPSEPRYELSGHQASTRSAYAPSDMPPSNDSSLQADKGLPSSRDSNMEESRDNGHLLNLSRSSSVNDDGHSAASSLAHLEQHYETAVPEQDSIFFNIKHTSQSAVVQRQSSYKCPVCDKHFLHNSSYNRHMKLHQGVFSHICAVCGRKFTRREHFVRHKCNRRPNKPSRVLSSGEEAASEHLAYPPSPHTLSHMGLQGDSPGSLGDDGHSQSDLVGQGGHSIPIGLHQHMPLNIEPAPSIQDDSVLELTKSRRKPTTPQRIDMSIADDESEGLDLTTDERRSSAPPSLIHGETNQIQRYDRPQFPRMIVNSPMEQSPPDMQSSSPTASAYDDQKAQHPETPTDYSTRPPHEYLPSQLRTNDRIISHKQVYTRNSNQEDFEQQQSNEGDMKYRDYGDINRDDHQNDRDGEGSPTVWPSASHPFSEGDQQPSGSPTYSDNTSQANDREMNCPICEKKFLHLSSLNRHLKLHQGVFTHVCAVCGRRFTRKEHFMQHKCSRRPKDPTRLSDRHVPLEDSAQCVAFPPSLHGNLQHEQVIAPSNDIEAPADDMARTSAVSGKLLLSKSQFFIIISFSYIYN